VEVLRGPQSGLYGSDAIGGVVSITTRDGEGPLVLTGMAEGGSFDTANQSVRASGSEGAFHYSASLQHDHTGAVAVTPRALLLPGEKRNDDFYDNITASTKLGYDVTEDFSLGFAGHYNDSLGKITNDGFNLSTFTSFPSPDRSRIDTLQYDARGTAHLSLWEGRFDQTLGLAYNSSAISSADPDNGYSLAAGSRTKLDWQGDVKLTDGETIVLGAESGRDAIHSPLSAGFTTNAGYGELQSVIGDFASSLSIRYDDNSRFGGKVTWHAAPTYTIAATGTRLKASFGTGFKAPSLQDLFGPFGHNPNLKPETSSGYDLGFEQSLGDSLSAGVTWYHNDIRNLIQSGPPPSFTPGNIGKARTQGVESFIAWQAMPGLSLRADYTYTEAEDTAAHSALLRRPHHKASLNARWQASDDLSLDATLLYVGPRADIGRESFLTLKDADYTTVKLAANYRLTDRFGLFGRLENALGQRYEDPNGFQRPGFGAFAGIKASF
jgi:vitamin B12 transporter